MPKGMIKDLIKVAVISTSIIVAIAVLFSYLDGDSPLENAAKNTEPASSSDPAPIVPARREMPPPAPAHNASDAWVMCQVFAERRLRAPSTAKWPHRPDSGVKETDTRYRVIGYVDA